MAYYAAPYREEQHRPMLETLWRESFDPAIPRDMAAARARWLYEANPEGAAMTMTTTADESPELIACASYFPRAVLVHGERVRAGVLCDFAVDKRHRTAGAAIAVQRALAKTSWSAGYRFLFGFPNEASVAVCKRVGYKVVGSTATWVKPLRSGYKLRLPRAPFLEAPAAFVVDQGLAAFDEGLARLVARHFEGEEVSTPDARFDRLWERVAHRRGISGERTAAYLTWRYADFTTAKHNFYCIRRKGESAISGYVVYSTDGERAVVQDLCADDLEETVDALLVRLAVLLRSRKVSSLVLSYLGSEAFGNRLGRLGFFKRAGDRLMVAYVDPALPEPEKREILEPANWFILDGELDI